jgi:hypothetical protein
MASFHAHCGNRYLQVEYICDVHGKLSLTETQRINATINALTLRAHYDKFYDHHMQKYRCVPMSTPTRYTMFVCVCRIGFVIVDQLHLPQVHTEFWTGDTFECLRQLSMDDTARLTYSANDYLDTFIDSELCAG